MSYGPLMQFSLRRSREGGDDLFLDSVAVIAVEPGDAPRSSYVHVQDARFEVVGDSVSVSKYVNDSRARIGSE